MQTVTFPTELGELSGTLFLPTASRAPALVIVHEWYGVNEEMRRMAQRFADEGFVALAVDLYHGQVTSDAAVAMQLSNDLSTATAMKEIAGATTFLASHAATNGKVGITGFCLGGAMALAAAFNVEGLSAALPFYGNPRADFVHLDRKTPPIQGHYAAKDPFIDITRTRSIAEGVREHGGSFELFEYEGGHAFMRASDPAAYHEASAKLAWNRAIPFLRAHLAS